jgi:hypothetical protein
VRTDTSVRCSLLVTKIALTEQSSFRLDVFVQIVCLYQHLDKPRSPAVGELPWASAPRSSAGLNYDLYCSVRLGSPVAGYRLTLPRDEELDELLRVQQFVTFSHVLAICSAPFCGHYDDDVSPDHARRSSWPARPVLPSARFRSAANRAPEP